jgi:hypothetical protein
MLALSVTHCRRRPGRDCDCEALGCARKRRLHSSNALEHMPPNRRVRGGGGRLGTLPPLSGTKLPIQNVRALVAIEFAVRISIRGVIFRHLTTFQHSVLPRWGVVSLGANFPNPKAWGPRETTRVHCGARRRGGMAVGGARATVQKIPVIGVLWPNPPSQFEFMRNGLTDLVTSRAKISVSNFGGRKESSTNCPNWRWISSTFPLTSL